MRVFPPSEFFPFLGAATKKLLLKDLAPLDSWIMYKHMPKNRAYYMRLERSEAGGFYS